MPAWRSERNELRGAPAQARLRSGRLVGERDQLAPPRASPRRAARSPRDAGAGARARRDPRRRRRRASPAGSRSACRRCRGSRARSRAAASSSARSSSRRAAPPRGGSGSRARAPGHTTLPRTSKPLRPARPAIWRNSRTRRIATFSPSNLHSFEKSTRADRDVDAHAERVRAAHDLQQAALRQPFHQQPVARQQPRVVDADPVAQDPAHVLAVRRVESRVESSASAMRARSSRVEKFALVSPCASSPHSRCVKFTT